MSLLKQTSSCFVEFSNWAYVCGLKVDGEASVRATTLINYHPSSFYFVFDCLHHFSVFFPACPGFFTLFSPFGPLASLCFSFLSFFCCAHPLWWRVAICVGGRRGEQKGEDRPIISWLLLSCLLFFQFFFEVVASKYPLRCWREIGSESSSSSWWVFRKLGRFPLHYLPSTRASVFVSSSSSLIPSRRTYPVAPRTQTSHKRSCWILPLRFRQRVTLTWTLKVYTVFFLSFLLLFSRVCFIMLILKLVSNTISLRLIMFFVVEISAYFVRRRKLIVIIYLFSF